MQFEGKRRSALSTTSGGVILIAIIIILGVGVYLFTPGPTQSGTTQASTTTPYAVSATISIPSGASGGLNFSPSDITVTPGTTITWTDQDSAAVHDIAFTSVPSGASTPGSSPNLSTGDTFQATLTTPGTYHYECQYHSSWMQGVIVVS